VYEELHDYASDRTEAEQYKVSGITTVHGAEDTQRKQNRYKPLYIQEGSSPRKKLLASINTVVLNYRFSDRTLPG
jgi:hypothetical protein